MRARPGSTERLPTHPHTPLSCQCVSLIMVAVLRSLVALMLLLGQVWLSAAAGLLPDVERRKHAPEHSERFLRDFELRLLNMFGLKRKPTPSKGAVVPQYMLDLYYMHSENGDQKGSRRPRSVMGKHAERAAGRANTIRSFHHEGESAFYISASLLRY